MTAPSPDLVRAVRAGCDAGRHHLRCDYPDCGCDQFPRDLRAALAKPSDEMIEAGAEAVWERLSDVMPFGTESGRALAKAVSMR